jgi:hypothetical protein
MTSEPRPTAAPSAVPSPNVDDCPLERYQNVPVTPAGGVSIRTGIRKARLAVSEPRTLNTVNRREIAANPPVSVNPCPELFAASEAEGCRFGPHREHITCRTCFMRLFPMQERCRSVSRQWRLGMLLCLSSLATVGGGCGSGSRQAVAQLRDEWTRQRAYAIDELLGEQFDVYKKTTVRAHRGPEFGSLARAIEIFFRPAVSGRDCLDFLGDPDLNDCA